MTACELCGKEGANKTTRDRNLCESCRRSQNLINKKNEIAGVG